MSIAQDVSQHVKTLERPQWMFWGDRKAAVQAIECLGTAAGEKAIEVLGKVVRGQKAKLDLRIDAARALVRLGSAAKPSLAGLIGFLMALERERASVIFSELPFITLKAIASMRGSARSAVPTLAMFAMHYGMRSLEALTGGDDLDHDYALSEAIHKFSDAAAQAVAEIVGKDWPSTLSFDYLIEWWESDGKGQGWN